MPSIFRMGPPEAAFCITIIMSCLMMQCSGVDEKNACPLECSCFEHESKDGIVSNCSKDNGQVFPNIPLNTVELHLSHYNHSVFSSKSIPSLVHLERLVINHCMIEQFENHAISVNTFPQLKVLDLRFNKLKQVPHGLSINIKTLLLSNNDITILSGTSLLFLPNLRELFLDCNKIESIEESSFKNPEENDTIILPNLHKLTLNNNSISMIHDNSLNSLPFLNAVTFAHNKISDLNSNTFKNLVHLKFLDLSHNQLKDIQPETFFKLSSLKTLYLSFNLLSQFPVALPMLEWLDISHNNIKHIAEEGKSDIYPVEVLNIAHNPLHCDCAMLWLKELYDQREYQLKHIEIPTSEFVPMCKSPASVAGESWDMLGNSLFGCKNLDTTSEELDPGAEPDLVVKTGKVTGDTIEVYWSWDVKGPLSFSNIYIQYYVFGLRGDTTRHVEVAAVIREFTLKNLRPMTNYVICVIPKNKQSRGNETPKPLSLDHCVEVTTKEGEPIEVLSFFYIVLFYLFGMCATLIAIFSVIGLIALAYGIYSSKSDWSSKNIRIDEPIDDDYAYRQAPESESGSQSSNDFTESEQKEHKD